MIFRRLRMRKPDGVDESGVPFWYLRPVRHPRLHSFVRRIDRLHDRAYRGNEIFWWWRGAGWAIFAIPLGFVRWWFALVGVAFFELTVIVLFQWSWRRVVKRRALRS